MTITNDDEKLSAREVTRLIRVAAYIRWSTADQRYGYSKEAQLRIIKEDVARRGWHLVEIYIDDARSGTSLKKRTSFARMVADAKAGRFDVVVVAQLDRFARNMKDALEQLDILEKTHGVQVRSVKEDIDPTAPSSSLIRAIMFASAETFSLNLSSEVRKGQREMLEDGRHPGSAPFGYTMLDAYTRNSRLAPGPEAPLVKIAFEMYASGKHGMTDIAATLNGLLTKRRSTDGVDGTNETDKAFGRRKVTRDTIRYILRNRIYRGVSRYGDAEATDLSLAIIDEEVFEEVQRRLKMNGTRPLGPYRKKFGHLLTGVITCRLCGGKLDGVTRSPTCRYYRDRNRTMLHRCERPRGVNANDLDARVAEDLIRVSHILPKDALEQIQASLDSTDTAQEARRTIVTLKDDIERLTYVYRKRNITQDEYDTAERNLKQQIARCEDLLDLSLERALRRVIAALRDFPSTIPYHDLDALDALNARVRDLFVDIEVGDDHTQCIYQWTPEALLLFDLFSIDPNSTLPVARPVGMVPIVKAMELYAQRPLPHTRELDAEANGQRLDRRTVRGRSQAEYREPCDTQHPPFNNEGL